jgi:hypothetical protein
VVVVDVGPHTGGRKDERGCAEVAEAGVAAGGFGGGVDVAVGYFAIAATPDEGSALLDGEVEEFQVVEPAADGFELVDRSGAGEVEAVVFDVGDRGGVGDVGQATDGVFAGPEVGAVGD